jgi:hypothetical protein
MWLRRGTVEFRRLERSGRRPLEKSGSDVEAEPSHAQRSDKAETAKYRYNFERMSGASALAASFRSGGFSERNETASSEP